MAASGAGTLAVFDTATLRRLAAVSNVAGGFLVFLPSGHRLYSIGYVGSRKLYVGSTTGWVAMLDALTNTVINNISVGRRPEAVVTKR